MIKNINSQNFITTPCVITKPWCVSNVINDDLLLAEQTGSSGEDLAIAVEYLDYAGSSPFLNRNCSIALEQQTDDSVIYREGEKSDGNFFPDTAPKNPDGTYKRLVYSYIKSAFYNNRRNPVEIFGIDNIDFQLGKTDRYLADNFREFGIPQQIFGDRITEGTVRVTDNTLDDNVNIIDDSYGNLIASNNLFSKIQEIGYFNQELHSGSIDIGCPSALLDIPDAPTSLTSSLTASISGAYTVPPYEVNLNWTDNSTIENGFDIFRSITTNGVTWTPWSQIGTVGTGNTTYADIIASAMLSASYYVESYNYVGNSTGSNIVFVTGST